MSMTHREQHFPLQDTMSNDAHKVITFNTPTRPLLIVIHSVVENKQKYSPFGLQYKSK